MSGASVIANFRKKVDLKCDNVFRAVCLEMSRRIIYRSPVDTGRFRGNWNASVGYPNTATSDKTSASGASALSTAMQVGKTLNFGDTFFMTNNLPYARRLEYGYSNQAPSGMVRVTVAEFKNLVNAQAMAVKNG